MRSFSHAPTDRRFSPNIDAHTGYHTTSLLAVPLRVRNAVIGVLEVVNRREGDFTEADGNLVETLAASGAIAIDNARLVEALRQRTTELLSQVLRQHIGVADNHAQWRLEVVRHRMSKGVQLLVADL